MPTDGTFLLTGLLILIALGGWAFGQFFDHDRDLQLPTRISADYLRGLNLVLSRKTDEALELFIQMAKVDDDTLETHFALGHLFRRRGEVDRAIRVHQNLLARPNLNDLQRHQALHALAEDYLGAGLFDRAEKLFSELSESETLGESALERLIYIYERESEWGKAIETHRRLEAASGERSSQVAHYYCELAEQALKDGNLDAAREHLKGTIRSESGALRGNLIRAWIAKNEEDYPKALRLYEQIIEKDRGFISEVIPNVFACYEGTGRTDEFERYIEHLISRDPGVATDLAYSAIVANITESPALTRCVESFVIENDVLSHLVSIDVLKGGSAGEKDEALARISEGLRALARSNARYRCANCGYSTQKFIWHCPSCKLWESIKPIQRFQLESIMS